MNLNEVRVLTTVRLSETQKIVMVRVVSADNPHVAYESLNEGRNLVAASKELTQLGLLEIMQGEANITDKGTQVLTNEGLVDEMGELTEEGQKYATEKGPSEKGKDTQPPQPTEQGAEQPPMGDMGASGGDDMGMGGDEMQMQSFDLLSSIEDSILLSEQLARLK